jgi:hypothetical protein
MSEQLCTHDWWPFWDGSLGYAATDCCRVCGDYRETPATPYTEQETTK